jgi:CxxC-x17-CxxC domain-containing protein
MEFVDRQLACVDCGQPFVFSAGEQEFYDRKGFREEPKRCKPCRETRKQRRNGHLTEGLGPSNGHQVDDDSIGNRMGPPPQQQGRGPREARDVARGGRELFEAVCAQCGSRTRVPFRPVAGRPVYCRDCYGARRGVGGS